MNANRSVVRLKRGAISSIARMTGINIHTVRRWIVWGEPDQSKLSTQMQNELRKAIESHRIVAQEEGI